MTTPFWSRLWIVAPWNRTGTPGAAQQRHEQRRLGVALPEAVGQNLRRRDVVAGVVAERDFVPHEPVDGADPRREVKAGPSTLLGEVAQRGVLVVEQAGRAEVAVHAVDGRKRGLFCA